MTPSSRRRAYTGPALFSQGFRPFFLVGAIHAGLAMLIWLALLFGRLRIPSAFTPMDWHVHEMLYGYLPAVATGFLLTMVPNWTGRLPLQGGPLAVLVAAWAAGRLAVLLSALIGPLAAGAIDLSFLLLVAAAVAREVIAGRDWRSLPPLGLIVMLAVGNAVFHVDAGRAATAQAGARIGVAAAVMLIALIGGRIIPSFTRHWVARRNPGRQAAPHGRYDVACLAASALALACWTALPDRPGTALLLLTAGIAHAVRLARWAGDRTFRERLVFSLHVGYAFVPGGFILLGAAAFWPRAVPIDAGIHAWTVGAIGIMTLAVMARASLSHAGRHAHAGPLTQAIHAAILVAALARIGAAFGPSLGAVLLPLAGAAWIAAFWTFASGYGPLLARPRKRPAEAPASTPTP